MLKVPARLFAVTLTVVVVAHGSSVVAQSLPSGWSSSDIGSVGAAGSASGSGGSFDVDGAGADIWGSADAFRFVYRTLAGNGSIVTQVVSEEPVSEWTKAGVMMRETLSPGSKHASVFVTPGKGLAFQRRTSTGGSSTHTSVGTSKAPYWVKLTRAGNVFTAFTSANGSAWTTAGSVTISMTATIYVGLPVGSHIAGTLASVSFGSTAVTEEPPSGGGTTTTETLVFLRHGEKPSGGLGQITCQGLQRALALPPVLIGRYGTPQYIFAPNTGEKVTDPAGTFNYVRPLATIEPTAIRLGMPVNTEFGFTDITGLQNELLSTQYASATVFIAWEHLKLKDLVQNIMSAYGGGATVPAWPSGDFDSIYLVELTRTGSAISARFTHEFEGLNNLSTACP